MIKICTKCKKRKILNEFCKNKNSKDKHNSVCKNCFNKYYKQYIKSPKVKEHNRKYNTKWMKKRRQNDVLYRLQGNIGSLLWDCLKSQKEGKKWEGLVGYTVKDLMIHLEKQFDKNMNWNNYGSYWHVDHIKPVSLFKYRTYKDKEFKECWALENLQPLERIANIKKGNKY